MTLSADAFSHGQIRSKQWLSGHFRIWEQQHLSQELNYTLNWYGSWVGVGPFLLLSHCTTRFKKIRLLDMNGADLATSVQLLDYWKCESVEIETLQQDINSFCPPQNPEQVFINTACEHVTNDAWLRQIPPMAPVLLQSTDMPHAEHINSPTDLTDFRNKYREHIDIISLEEIHFNYPDKKFSRFMLFGKKR